MTLKEQMARDAVTFLDPKEFGEELMVDGLSMLGCWDEEVQPAPRFFGTTTMDVIGVNTVERLLFLLPESSSWPCPVSDQELDVDGVIWTVRDARPESGIFKLTVYRNES